MKVPALAGSSYPDTAESVKYLEILRFFSISLAHWNLGLRAIAL
jgi:hypothetical protein